MTMLLSQHDGSLNHCYHFWMGYYLPACEWMIENPDVKSIRMIECGPMTRWITYLKRYRDIDIIKPRTALNFYVGDKPSHIFKKQDSPDNIINVSYLSKTNTIKENFFPKRNNFDTEIAIIERKDPNRKYIPNLNDIKPVFENVGTTEIIDTVSLSVPQTVDKFSEVKILVGQFGAGLTNMIWMKPGSIVIEIRPPQNDTGILYANDVYKDIAYKLGIKHIVVEAQKDWYSNVDLNKIKKVVDSL